MATDLRRTARRPQTRRAAVAAAALLVLSMLAAAACDRRPADEQAIPRAKPLVPTSSEPASRTPAPPAPISPSPSPSREPTPYTSPPALRKAFGVSYGDRLSAVDPRQLAAILADAKSLGVTWIRVQLGWDGVQPNGPSQYQWGNFDRIVRAANTLGLGLLPVLTFTPSWARVKGCDSPRCRPEEPRQFGAFAGAAAKRYGKQGVHTWEIWNEPNTRGAWLPLGADAGQYVSDLRAAHDSIRAADPTAYILSGGLASTASAHGSVSQLDFLQQMCSLGGNRLVDAIGYHPYSYPVLPDNSVSWNAWSQIAKTPRSFVSVLSAYGTAQLPIWITEYGAPTGGPGAEATTADPQIRNRADHVDEQYQALMATNSVRSVNASPRIDALFWYTDRDLGVDSRNVENFFGLRRLDGTAKPAYHALHAALHNTPATQAARQSPPGSTAG